MLYTRRYEGKAVQKFPEIIGNWGVGRGDMGPHHFSIYFWNKIKNFLQPSQCAEFDENNPLFYWIDIQFTLCPPEALTCQFSNLFFPAFQQAMLKQKTSIFPYDYEEKLQ